jgi:hypothetical protein
MAAQDSWASKASSGVKVTDLKHRILCVDNELVRPGWKSSE